MNEDPRPVGECLQARLDRIGQHLHSDPSRAVCENQLATHGDPSVPEPAPAEDQGSGDAGEWTYSPSVFAQLSLPYRDPGDVPRWVRTNGLKTLTVRPGEWYDPRTGQLRVGYPYGVLPRLVVLWMATEAKRTKQRELVLGPSLTAFTTKLIIRPSSTGRRAKPGGGPTGSLTRLADQLRRMLTATVTILDQRSCGAVAEHRSAVFSFASESRLWWSQDLTTADEPLWDSTVTISAEFYDQIASEALPLRTEDLVVLRSRTSSPLALDTYVFFAHRLHRVKGSPCVSWAELAVQFGGDYGRTRDFKAQFLKELAHVLAVYPTARVEPGPKGLVLRHSPSPVPPKSPFARPRPIERGRS